MNSTSSPSASPKRIRFNNNNQMNYPLDASSPSPQPFRINIGDNNNNNNTTASENGNNFLSPNSILRHHRHQNHQATSPSVAAAASSVRSINTLACTTTTTQKNLPHSFKKHAKLNQDWNLLFWALQDHNSSTGVITESSIHSSLAMILPVISWELPITDGECLSMMNNNNNNNKNNNKTTAQTKNSKKKTKVSDDLNNDDEAAAATTSSVMRNRSSTHQQKDEFANSLARENIRTATETTKKSYYDESSVKRTFFRRLVRRFLPVLGYRTQIPLSALDHSGLFSDPSLQHLDCFTGYAASAVCSRSKEILGCLREKGKEESGDGNDLQISEEEWMNLNSSSCLFCSENLEETTNVNGVDVNASSPTKPSAAGSPTKSEIIGNNNNTNNKNYFHTSSSLKNEILMSYLDEFDSNGVDAFRYRSPLLNSLEYYDLISLPDQNNTCNNNKEQAEAVRILFLVLLQNAPYLRFLLERYETPSRQLARVLIARRMQHLVMQQQQQQQQSMTATNNIANNNKNTMMSDDADENKQTQSLEIRSDEQHQQHPLYKKLADKQKQIATKVTAASNLKFQRQMKKQQKQQRSGNNTQNNQNNNNNSLQKFKKQQHEISSALIAQEFAQELCRWTLHLWAGGNRGILDTPLMQRIGEKYMTSKAKEFQKLAKRFKRFFVELETQDDECDALRAGKANDGKDFLMMNNNHHNTNHHQYSFLHPNIHEQQRKQQEEAMLMRTMTTSMMPYHQPQTRSAAAMNRNNQSINESAAVVENPFLLSTASAAASPEIGMMMMNNTSTMNNNNNNNNTLLHSSSPNNNNNNNNSNNPLNQLSHNPDLWLHSVENSMQPPPLSLLKHLLPEDRQELRNSRFWAVFRAFVVGFFAAVLIAGSDVIASIIIFGPDASTSTKLGLGADFAGDRSDSSSSPSSAIFGFFSGGGGGNGDNQQQQVTTTTSTTTTTTTPTTTVATVSPSFTGNDSTLTNSSSNNSSSTTTGDSQKTETETDSIGNTIILATKDAVLYWIIVIAVTAVVSFAEILYLYIDALNSCYDCAVTVGIVLRHKTEDGEQMSWRDVLRKELNRNDDDEDDETREEKELLRDFNDAVDAKTDDNHKSTSKSKSQQQQQEFYEELVEIFIPTNPASSLMNQQHEASPTGSPTHYFQNFLISSVRRQHERSTNDINEENEQVNSTSSPVSYATASPAPRITRNHFYSNNNIARVTRAKLRYAVLASFQAASRVREVLSRKRCKFIDGAISRCALSLGYSSISLFGIDLNLNKHGATKRLIKAVFQLIRTPLSVMIIQLFLGRYVPKVYLPFVSAPVCAFWNAVIIYNCLMQMEETAVSAVAAERLVLEVVQKSKEEVGEEEKTKTKNSSNKMTEDADFGEATIVMDNNNTNTLVQTMHSTSRARSMSHLHQTFASLNNREINAEDQSLNPSPAAFLSSSSPNNNNHQTQPRTTNNSLLHLLPDSVEPEFSVPHHLVQLWARAIFSLGTIDAVASPSFHILTAGLLQRLGPLCPMRLHGGGAIECEEEVAKNMSLTDRRLFFVQLCGVLFKSSSRNNTGNNDAENDDHNDHRRKIASCVLALQLCLLIVSDKIGEVVGVGASETKDNNNNDKSFFSSLFSSSVTSSSSKNSKYKRMICATIACYAAPKTTFAASSSQHQHQPGSKTDGGETSSSSTKNKHKTSSSSSSSSCCWCCWCVDTSCCEEIGEFSAEDIHASYMYKVNSRAKAISDHIGTFLFGNNIEKEILWNEVLGRNVMMYDNDDEGSKNNSSTKETDEAQKLTNMNEQQKSRSTTADRSDHSETEDDFKEVQHQPQPQKEQSHSPSPYFTNNNKNDINKPNASTAVASSKSMSHSPSPFFGNNNNNNNSKSLILLFNNNNNNSPSPRLLRELSPGSHHSHNHNHLSPPASPPKQCADVVKNLKSASPTTQQDQQQSRRSVSFLRRILMSMSKDRSSSSSNSHDTTSKKFKIMNHHKDDEEEDEMIDFILNSEGDFENIDSEGRDSCPGSPNAPFGTSASPERQGLLQPAKDDRENSTSCDDNEDDKADYSSRSSSSTSVSRGNSIFGQIAQLFENLQQNQIGDKNNSKHRLSKSLTTPAAATREPSPHHQTSSQKQDCSTSKSSSSLSPHRLFTQLHHQQKYVHSNELLMNEANVKVRKELRIQQSSSTPVTDDDTTNELTIQIPPPPIQQSSSSQNNNNTKENISCQEEEETTSSSSSEKLSFLFNQYHDALLNLNQRLMSLQKRYRHEGHLPRGTEVFDVASDMINLMSVWEYPE